MKALNLNITIKYKVFGYFLFCGLAVAMAEIYKNWMVMLQYDEPSILLVSSVIWEYIAFAFVAIIFPWSMSGSIPKSRTQKFRVIVTSIIFSLLYISILSLIEWLEFGRNYPFLNGWKFSLFHLPYILIAYAISSYLVFQLGVVFRKGTKYRHIKMEIGESKKIYAEVLKLLNENQYYLRTGIKVSDISQRLNLPINKVSRAINENLAGSFSDLVNQYRVSHAKRLLSDPHNQDKLYAIAVDSGFNNKVSFHQYFKKLEGISPQEYRDKQIQHSTNLKVS